MTYILGHDRSQILLLPEAVDNYVGSDNPARFIDAFVDGLDLSAASSAGWRDDKLDYRLPPRPPSAESGPLLKIPEQITDDE